MLRKAFLLSLALILVPVISHAEIKTYTHTVKQSFGGSQSPDDARVSAVHKAKREALEKAGAYLESLTIVKNSMVEKDEILALTAGVLKAEIVSQKNYHTEDAFGIIVVAKVDVDTSILEERIKKLLQDRELLSKYQKSQKREKGLLVKIARLEEENRELRTSPASTNIQKKEDLKKQFQETTQGLSAVEWDQKAFALLKDGKYTAPNQALEYLNEAINLDPNYALAYNSRGLVYVDLGKYQRAIEDYNQAIRLNPTDSSAYAHRGIAYLNLGQHQQAIEDYNQSIQLYSKDFKTYFNRGFIYAQLGQHQRAVEDYNQSILLNPHFKNYAHRGAAYNSLGKYQRAIEDCNQAILFNPEYSSAYNHRGIAYIALNQFSRGCDDFRKACEMGDCKTLSLGKENSWCR